MNGLLRLTGRLAIATTVLPLPLAAAEVARVFTPADIIQWEAHSFTGETRYELTEIDGRQAVHALCTDGSASGLFYEHDIDLEDTPIIEWDWRVDSTFTGIDEQTRAGDDYAARLYAVDRHSVMRWRTRAINYVWASEMERGTQWDNAYQSRATMVAMRSGADADEGWVTERRDLREDFREIHGRDLTVLNALAIMTDCDDTGQAAEAWYGEIRLLSDMVPARQIASRAHADPPAANPGIDWQSPRDIATGPAHRGPWRMNESRFLFVDDPSVAFTADGALVIAWANQEEQDIVLQRFDVDGEALFDAPVNLSSSPGIFSWLPRIVAAGDDGERVYALWQDIVFSGGSHGGEIFFAYSTDGGRSFSQPRNLSQTEAGAGKGRLGVNYWHNGSLDIARAADGVIHTAWTEYEGALHVSRSTDGGRSFSTPLRVAGRSGELPARAPSLAVADDGAVYLAWTVGEDAAADIHLATSSDGGQTFGPPRAVASGAGHADAPSLVFGGDGTLHLFYAESPDGPLQRYRIRHARGVVANNGVDFEAPRTLVDPVADPGVESVAFPAAATAAHGVIHLIWERFPAATRRPLGLGHAFSTDGGAEFSAPAVLPGSDDSALGFNGSQQGLLMRKLAVAADGRVAVVNSHYRDGEASRIRLYVGVPGEPSRGGATNARP
ncbi:MAG: DUF3047 domain-containing protein [Gammaproteobacteria bacterium]|nr:DUF3047 domain-containing protein [Gammaproteobacteria bacterium]